VRLKLLVIALSAVIFVSDRLAKIAVERSIPLHHSVSVLGDGVRLTHMRNTGVVFGFMGRPDHPMKGWPIALLSVAVLVAMLVYLWTAPQTARLLHWSLAFVIGGAIGNLWDRVVQGYVTDFMDISLAFIGLDQRWPAFNVADSAICVGVALMAIDVWRGQASDEQQPG